MIEPKRTGLRFARRIIVEDVAERLRCPDCGGCFRWRPRTRDFYHECTVRDIVVTKGPEGARITCIDKAMNG